MNQTPDFLSYLNGQVMPFSRAVAELQRSGEGTAGGFYDTERTFGGQVFELGRHLERLYNGVRFSGLDADISIQELEEVTLALLEANRPLLKPGQDFTISQIVTSTTSEDSLSPSGVTVVVYFQLLDFSAFARGYKDGVRVITPETYSLPDDDKAGGQVFPLMSNREGIITECKGANFMFVKDGRIKLPDRGNVLPGVSMHTILELAETQGISVDEGEYITSDVYHADEAFVSSTRFCMLPVASINGYSIGNAMPGPVTGGLLDGWKKVVGMDFAQQALDSSKPN